MGSKLTTVSCKAYCVITFTQLVNDKLFEVLIVPSQLAYKMAYSPVKNKNVVSRETLEIIARGPLNTSTVVDNKRWPVHSKSKRNSN